MLCVRLMRGRRVQVVGDVLGSLPPSVLEAANNGWKADFGPTQHPLRLLASETVDFSSLHQHDNCARTIILVRDIAGGDTLARSCAFSDRASGVSVHAFASSTLPLLPRPVLRCLNHSGLALSRPTRARRIAVLPRVCWRHLVCSVSLGSHR